MINTYKSLSFFVYKSFFILFITLSFLLLGKINTVKAAVPSCEGVVSGVGVMLPIYEEGDSHTIKINMGVSMYNPDSNYTYKVLGGSTAASQVSTSESFPIKSSGTYGSVTVSSNKVVTWKITDTLALKNTSAFEEIDRNVYIYRDGKQICKAGAYRITKNNTGGACALYISQLRNGKTCYSSGCLDSSTSSAKIEVEGLEDREGKPFTGGIKFVLGEDGWGVAKDVKTTANNGKGSGNVETDSNTTYTVKVVSTDGKNYEFPGCTASFKTIDYCSEDTCDEVRTDASGNALVRNFELCEQIPDPGERDKCTACFGGDGNAGNAGVWTAIGCIPAKPESIIKTFITLGISAGGGATFLLILAGSFRLSVSQGDPTATKEAKEQITAAIIGLVFIIFSITMLRFIGVTLFEIPGFGG